MRYRSIVSGDETLCVTAGGAAAGRPLLSQPALDVAPDAATFARILRGYGVDPDALAPDANGTILAEARTAPRAPLPVADLPVLVGSDAGVEIVLGAEIGRGGMGRIHVAEQRPLEREVAVKLAARGGSDTESAARDLLLEGRVTGRLEHPNIVPVHGAGRTAAGDVVVVMKRIDGHAWSRMLAARASTLDDLERHVGVLMDVCRAVQFAHSRGVLHRDLKPANVMVGSFGEVYLLDWGAAAALPGRAVAGLTDADAPAGVTGTPAFMAPEMTLPGEPLDERCDVYLLGAMLHVVLTGRAPHVGASLAETLHAAFVSAPPAFPADVPTELAGICARALSRDREARFAGAEELREALAVYLSHAGARDVIAEAQAEIEKLVSIVAGDAAQPDTPERDAAAHRAYSGARFGFTVALRRWPESAEAQDGLARTLRTMAQWEIRRGRAAAARVLVDELSEPAGDVALALTRLEASVAAADDERRRLDDLERSLDPRRGTALRVAVFIALGIIWLAFSLVGGVLQRSGAWHLDARLLAVSNIPMSGCFAVAAFVASRRRHVSVVTRNYFTAGAAGAACNGLMWATVAAFGAPVALGFAAAQIIIALAIFVSAAHHERATMLFAVVPLLGVPPILRFPAYAFDVNGVLFVVIVGLIVVYWERRRHRGA